MTTGKYVILKAKNGQFYFVLKACNGKTILQSETYKTLKSCENGIKSVRKNAATIRVKFAFSAKK